jgi:arylsulfatase A-like enzyme
MDSVRAHNTSLHGYRHDTTPFLFDLSTNATQYEQARAPSQWSLPSHTSIFTGKHVPEHGIIGDGDRLRPGETIFDELREGGYETGVFSANPYLTDIDTGLQSGFGTVSGTVREPPFDGIDPGEYKRDFRGFVRDSVRSGRPIRSFANGAIAKIAWDYPNMIPNAVKRKLASGTIPGSTYTDLFQSWVAGASEPWAACINYMDAHHPYTPASEFNQWDDGRLSSIQDSIRSMPLSFYTGEDSWWQCELLEYLYDGTIRQIDHEIQRVVEFLRETGEFENTLLVVTSDHGEGFGERSPVRDVKIAGHNIGEHEINLHVPLLIKHPWQSDGNTSSDLVSLTSLPAKIRSIVYDSNPTGEFVEKPVVAVTGGLRDVQQETLREQNVDLTPFQGESEVLYERDGDKIVKWIRWGESETVRERINTDATEIHIDEERLLHTFESFEDVGLKFEYRLRSVNEETEQRLKDLGYR